MTQFALHRRNRCACLPALLLAVALLCHSSHARLYKDGNPNYLPVKTTGGVPADEPAPQQVVVDSQEAAAQAAAAAWPSTTTRLRRHTKRQARAAFLAAQPFHPPSAALIDADEADGADAAQAAAAVGPSAVCSDKNLLAASNYPEDFRIIVTFQDPATNTTTSSSCTAFRIGPKHLGTAGHCIYRRTLGGWATAVDVYSGTNVCNGAARTTTGANMATTQRWASRTDDGSTSPWDAAVVKTAGTLPNSDYVLGQYGSPGRSRNVMITGYPSQNSESVACNSPQYAGACRQFSSNGKLFSTLNGGMYRTNAVDYCKGHSGSAVWDTDLKLVIGIVGGGGGSGSACMNFIVPQVNSTNASSRCEGTSGGVSLACLIKMIR